ncbi:MAG: hypothetical protein U1E29_18270 [Coriobacteriia bacterium]|nr:hypothetical protein [Coriobacteriia bacterium]
MTVTIDIGAPIADDLSALSYESYVSRGVSPIPEADWVGYREEAWRVLRAVSQGQAGDVTDAADIEKVREALCMTADALYSVKTGVTSERIGSYAYTLGQSLTIADAHRVATDGLSGMGLTYRGL